jgi:hypothetical protein
VDAGGAVVPALRGIPAAPSDMITPRTPVKRRVPVTIAAVRVASLLTAESR